jgi:hypothetical protein
MFWVYSIYFRSTRYGCEFAKAIKKAHGEPEDPI